MTACSNYDQMESELIPTKGSGESDHNFVTLEEALQKADEVFASIPGGKTRATRRVASVNLHGVATRSSETDLYGFYVVNYDEGFSILSADKRRNPVYAISEEGSVDLADTIYNEGLRWYVSEIMGAPVVSPNVMMPTDPVTPINPGWGDKTETIVFSEPLLSGMLKSMHQGAPFNNYASNSYAGCVPIAVTTIFAYHKWPTQYDDLVINWESLLNSSNDDVWGKIIQKLWELKNLNADPQPDGTSVKSTRIPITFYNWGYRGMKWEDFSGDPVKGALSSGNPVLMTGIRTDDKGVKHGHAWVCDGGYSIYTVSYQSPITEDDPSNGYLTTISNYFHMAWGWRTKANGYYYLYHSNPVIDPVAEKLDPDAYGNSLPYGELDILYGMQPNK